MEFEQITDIVNTAALSDPNLSQEALARLDDVVTVAEARKLLGQSGNANLANIPLMIALVDKDSADYKIDYNTLFGTLIQNRESTIKKLLKSYDEVTGLVTNYGTAEIQGVKLLTEFKSKLVRLLDASDERADYSALRETVDVFVKYLQVAYVLLGMSH